MPYDLFWHGDVFAVRDYAKADEIKKNRKNQELYLQGYYIYEALVRVAPALHAFSKKPEPMPYLDNVIPLSKKEQEEQVAAKEKERYEKLKQVMEQWAIETSERKEEQDVGQYGQTND